MCKVFCFVAVFMNTILFRVIVVFTRRHRHDFLYLYYTWQRAHSQPELFNPITTRAVIVVLSCWCRLRCAALSPSWICQCRWGVGLHTQEPLAQLLLISRLPPSSDMLSSDVASRWDGAAEPHRLVCVHKNQTHLFVNTVVSHAAVSQKKSSSWCSRPSSNLLCYPWQPSPTVTQPHITTLNVNRRDLHTAVDDLSLWKFKVWKFNAPAAVRLEDNPAAHSETCLHTVMMMMMMMAP